MKLLTTEQHVVAKSDLVDDMQLCCTGACMGQLGVIVNCGSKKKRRKKGDENLLPLLSPNKELAII